MICTIVQCIHSYFLVCLWDSNCGGDQGPKGAQDIVWGSSQRKKTLPSVESPFGSYKFHQLLLADENKAFFVETGNCIYWSRHENIHIT